MPPRCFFDNASDFRRALRGRRGKCRDGWRLLFCEQSPPLASARLGIVMSKRHARSAVQRNRIRRVLREHFRTELRLLLPPMDFLLLAIAPMPRKPDAARLRRCCRALLANAIGRPL